MPALTHSPAPRSVLDGKYALLRRLGSGATGTVYEAEHLTIGKRVAIKLMNPVVSEAEEEDRFVAEARALARIGHANVVNIFDFGLSEGVPYLVMELLSGETLQDAIEQRGAMPAIYACELMLQILAALGAAHAQGIIHCDLKPANVIVTHPRPERPLVKVLDFGIARSMHEVTLAQAERRSGSVGTPMYMSPEQALGHDVDARTDTYAAAAMLCSMLSGADPFSGKTTAAVIQQVLNGDHQSLRQIAPDLPGPLIRIVEKGLSKDPQVRFQSADDFADALRPFVQSVGQSVPLGPIRPIVSDPIPLIASPKAAKVLEPELPQSTVVKISRDALPMSEAALLDPRIPKAPTSPRLELGRDFTPFGSNVSWEPVIREKSWFSSEQFRAMRPAITATVIGFGLGCVVAWAMGLI